MAEAIAENGLEAAQYQVALKQVEALAKVGAGDGKQTVLLPAHALDAFADAFAPAQGLGVMIWEIWWVWVAPALVLAILEVFAPGFIFVGLRRRRGGRRAC